MSDEGKQPSHPEDEHSFWWLNAKADFDDYRVHCKSMQEAAKVQFDQLAASHNDLVKKLNVQYAEHALELNKAHTTHVNNCNKATIASFLTNSENMRHGYNLLTNLDVPEAVAMGEILDQPQKAAIEAFVLQILSKVTK